MATCEISAGENVLASFTDLADQDRQLVSGAEREILNDFLAFVDKNFRELGPFNTLASCAEDPSRIRRRLDAIMSELLGTGGKTLPGIHTSVKLAVLEYESEKRLVELRLWPADTLQPARAFYRRRETVDRVLTLTSDGWSVSPNFHFGFMASGCCWTSTTMPVSEYLGYWAEHINDTAQIERPDWGEYWDRLVNLKIAAPADREAFGHYFTDTARTFAAPRPGVSPHYAR
jgi:hypothetical protein